MGYETLELVRKCVPKTKPKKRYIIMGNKAGKMNRKRSEHLATTTNFTAEEILALEKYFQSIGKAHKGETHVDRTAFKNALGLKESLFINRLFLMFDNGE